MCSTLLLYTLGTSITDAQFLYIDLVALVPLSIVQAWTGSYEKLSNDVPTATLFYFPVLASVIVSSMIQAAFQAYFFYNVQKQPFYEPIDPSEFVFGNAAPCFEGTVLFMIANTQYLVTCLAFSVAKPFRKPFWTNSPFLICVIVLVFVDTALVFVPFDNAFGLWAGLLPFKTEAGESYYSYRYMIAGGIVINTFLTFIAEKLIVHVLTRSWDQKNRVRKLAAFSVTMEAYRAEIEKRDRFTESVNSAQQLG